MCYCFICSWCPENYGSRSLVPGLESKEPSPIYVPRSGKLLVKILIPAAVLFSSSSIITFTASSDFTLQTWSTNSATLNRKAPGEYEELTVPGWGRE
ncbi:hypothetical protein BJX62DRAFT_206608 [Aspergillus germanicus]